MRSCLARLLWLMMILLGHALLQRYDGHGCECSGCRYLRDNLYLITILVRVNERMFVEQSRWNREFRVAR